MLTNETELMHHASDTGYHVTITPPTNVASSFYEYAANYNKAAQIITLHLLSPGQTCIAELDTYIFSLAFLYRHSIELILKAIAFQRLRTATDQAQFIKHISHSLDEILKYIEQSSPSPRPSPEMEWLRSYLGDITKLDNESDSFRYPFHIISEKDKQNRGQIYSIVEIFDKQTHIDLTKFTDKFKVAYKILDKWYLNDSENAVELCGLAPKFIEQSGYYYKQSVVRYGYYQNVFHPYTRGYFETADFLRAQMRSKKNMNTQIETKLFLPMCYLYRNYTELSLKAVWFQQTNEDFQTRCKLMIKKKHSIRGMWNIICQYAVQCNVSDADSSFIDVLANFYKCHNVLDCDASQFRYPMQQNMRPYFRDQQTFDYENVGAFFEALNNAVTCIEEQLRDINE